MADWSESPKWLIPRPTPEDREYWEGAHRGELRIQHCTTCGQHQHYARMLCSHCGAQTLEWVTASGHGTVYSYTVTHQDVPGYTAPFAVVIVELEEQAGLRMVSNVVDVPPEDVRIGMPVEVTFQPVAEDVWLPLFKKR